MFFGLLSKTSLVNMVSASFLFFKSANQKETEYYEYEVGVKLKTKFSLKLGLLELIRKSCVYIFDLIIHKARQKSYGLKI